MSEGPCCSDAPKGLGVKDEVGLGYEVLDEINPRDIRRCTEKFCSLQFAAIQKCANGKGTKASCIFADEAFLSCTAGYVDKLSRAQTVCGDALEKYKGRVLAEA
mmetsp:Transcript_19896/g.50837  ORF Transcript_19896/g.50837 Transcript_19896/m.50837 type:complete len:104 (-) Transcript_19896:281-592(-)